VKQAIFAYVNHARIRSWNQPVLSNEGKVCCSRKQREPVMGAQTHKWQFIMLNTLTISTWLIKV